MIMELKVDLADGNRKENTCKIHTHTHTHTYTHTHTHTYIYIYIYIYVVRECDGELKRES